MSAIQDITHEPEADQDASLVDAFAHRRSASPSQDGEHNWYQFIERFRDRKLVQKVRSVTSLYSVLAVAIALVMAIGLYQVIGRYNAHADVQQAAEDAAELRYEASNFRYNSVRFVFGGEEAALERQRTSYENAKNRLEAITEVVRARVPLLTSQADQLAEDLIAYDAKFEELRASLAREGQSQTSIGLAYELSAQGDTLIERTSTFGNSMMQAADSLESSALAYFNYMSFVILTLIVIGAAAMVIGIRYFAGDFAGKIAEISAGMTQLAQGDRDFEIEGIERKDEIGEMLQAMALFKRASVRLEQFADERAKAAAKQLEQQQERQREREEAEKQKSGIIIDLADQFERTVGDIVSGVASASSQLQATASTMAASAEESTRQTAEVAKSMEEANAGATAAAAASDEFAMSIGEISRQAASSAELARDAAIKATKADETISELSDSAEQIGHIVELIQTIAQRTNLLALNASIEAARGGEAGRGFAVVASEVKELAMQTSRATEKVSEQIQSMQETTGASVEALRSIASQVQQLETTAVSIASAVDQQSVAGQDLARSIDLAARSTDRVSSHVDEVRELSLATGAAATQVLSSATDLEEQASSLRTQMQSFLGKVRSG